MKPSRKFAALLFALDAMAFLGVFYLSAFVRGLLPGSLYLPSDLLLPFGLLVILLYLIDGYKPRTDMMGLDYTSQHVIAVGGAATLVLLFTYVFITSSFSLHSSRGVLMASFVVLAPVTLSYRRILYGRHLLKRGSRSIVFVGDSAHCEQFRAEYARNAMMQPLILCRADDVTSNAGASGKDDAHTIERVLGDVISGRIDIEAIVLQESNRELPSPVSQQLVGLYFGGVPTYTLELFHQVYWRKIPLYRLNQTWLFQEGFQIAREPMFERLKRISDLLFAGVGTICASPLVLLAAALIWFEDRQNPIFSQTRIGQNHKPFKIYKLRTMRNSPTGASDPYTREGDIRITRVGRILRATRIDELPQLWNVLAGDMSLIGPRAEWDRLVGEYERKIPCYHFRHLVKPGITGWAQVNYPYGSSIDDTLRKLEFDLYYIRHYSFMLDAAIVLKTIHIMLFGKGR